MKKLLKRVLGTGLILFILANVMIYNHAYKFTHFVDHQEIMKKKPEMLSMTEKAQYAFTGVTVSKPQNSLFPKMAYQTIPIQSHQKLEAWLVQVPDPKGVVLIFHGYSGSKGGVANYGDSFNAAGYHTLLVDFQGNGGSEGLTTTIGYHEGRDVMESLSVADSLFPEVPKYLIGSSMGAAAILRSVVDYDIQPDKIILECPFSTMLETVRVRFGAMGAPAFPFAEMLVFYGGWQNDFDAFSHNPVDYAKTVYIPTLLISGAHDPRVSMKETKAIFTNLKGPKKMVILPNSGHENYHRNDREAWEREVLDFLNKE